MMGALAGFPLSGGKADNVQAAANIAQSTQVNNYLRHEQITAMEEEMAACGTDYKCKAKVTDEYLERSAENDQKLRDCETAECRQEHLDEMDRARAYAREAIIRKAIAIGNDNARYYAVLAQLEGNEARASAVHESAIREQAYKDALDGECGGDQKCASEWAQKAVDTYHDRQRAKADIAGLAPFAIGAPSKKPTQPAGAPKKAAGNNGQQSAGGGTNKALISEGRANHILHGDDGINGGHLWPGGPDKSPFPQSWSSTKVLDEINSIASNPSIPSKFQLDGRIVKEATVDGIDIKVVIEFPAKGGGVVTGFPTNFPGNPKMTGKQSQEYYDAIERQREIKRLLIEALNKVKGDIPEQGVSDVQEYIEHGEYGVGWELLWYVVLDKKLEVSDELVLCGRKMGFDVSCS